MDRREFLSWVGVGALASYLPVAIAACSPQTEEEQKVETKTETKTETKSKTTTGASKLLAVGTIEELDKGGQILNREEKIIVVRNPENAKIIALNATCPHLNCLVEWEAKDKNIKCPCHGSRFAPDGELLKGPAGKDLPNYEVKEENGSILVKVSS